ncbi:Unknown protein sequence [Pseudomonas syringae pv. syringae]|nr:Unknown protein sequence [Pseudomonas syringae pv. syringae]
MFFEYELLGAYAHHCDEMGLAICNDLQSKWRRPAIIAFFDRD